MLLIIPIVKYNNEAVKWNSGEQTTTIAKDKVLLIQRNKEAEEKFVQTIRNSHVRFGRYTNHNYFHLQSKDALNRNWFLNFMALLRREKVQVIGLNQLKKFRFNQNKPQTKLELSSNIDWFDAEVEVTFGSQPASIRNIKKALSRKQNYIPLDDGSLGILPEEWMEKYSLLFRLGPEPESGLRVSKHKCG